MSHIACNNINVYGYLRISTDKQDISNCKKEILIKANSLGFKNIIWIEETESGKTDWKKRELGKHFNIFKAGDVLITSEISRLGRTITNNIEFLAKCSEKKINVYFTKSDFKVDDSIQSQILIFSYSLSAQIEREMISSRTKSGLARCRENGIKVGRKKNISKLDDKKEYIVKSIQDGVKLNAISKKLQCSDATLSRFVKKYQLKNILGQNKYL